MSASASLRIFILLDKNPTRHFFIRATSWRRYNNMNVLVGGACLPNSQLLSVRTLSTLSPSSAFSFFHTQLPLRNHSRHCYHHYNSTTSIGNNNSFHYCLPLLVGSAVLWTATSFHNPPPPPSLLSSATRCDHDENHISHRAAAALAANHNVPAPAQQQPQENHHENGNDDDMSSIPMYENVPEHDEETDCFLCRTHRQGPCRPQWRNFEYCAKDHGDDNDGAAAHCAIYTQAFQECWMKHLNLYLLIAMTINQERIHELEHFYLNHDNHNNHASFKSNRQPKATLPSPPPQDLTVSIQWQEWNDLIEQEGFLDSVAQIKAVFDHFEKGMPIWKVYDALQQDPFVVNLECHVPTRRQTSWRRRRTTTSSSSNSTTTSNPNNNNKPETIGRVLKVVYAVDQEDRAIGLADFDVQYELEKAQKEGRELTADDLNSHRLMLSIVPGVTEAIQVKALYVQQKQEDENENHKDIDEDNDGDGNDDDDDDQHDEDDDDEDDEGMATDDWDTEIPRRPPPYKGAILVTSKWIPLPGLERAASSDPTL